MDRLAVSTDSVRATKLFIYVIDNNDYQYFYMTMIMESCKTGCIGCIPKKMQ